jgi:hypothetical protein
MNTTLVALIVSGCLFAAVLLGNRLRRLLPQHHLSAESKDAVKLAMGLVATMTALLLGLLVSSAKGSYDSAQTQVIQMAAKTALLDRVLALYGPESAPVRARFHELIEEAVRQMWSPNSASQAQLAPNIQAGNALFFALQGLAPRDDTQRSLKTQALALAVDIAQIRTLLVAQSVPSISKPLLIVVVAWLVVIFLSFSLVAPANATAILALLVSALSVSGAIFLILELDRPFGGFIQVSSEPLLNALHQFSD